MYQHLVTYIDVWDASHFQMFELLSFLPSLCHWWVHISSGSRHDGNKHFHKSYGLQFELKIVSTSKMCNLLWKCLSNWAESSLAKLYRLLSLFLDFQKCSRLKTLQQQRKTNETKKKNDKRQTTNIRNTTTVSILIWRWCTHFKWQVVRDKSKSKSMIPIKKKRSKTEKQLREKKFCLTKCRTDTKHRYTYTIYWWTAN